MTDNIKTFPSATTTEDAETPHEHKFTFLDGETYTTKPGYLVVTTTFVAVGEKQIILYAAPWSLLRSVEQL